MDQLVRARALLTKWLGPDGITGQSVPLNVNRIPRGNTPTRIDTRAKEGDITENINGELIVWGNMQDEELRTVEVRRVKIPCETLLSPDQETHSIF